MICQLHKIRNTKNIVQVCKYLFTGLITNLSSYALYFLLTVAGMGPKTSMSLLFFFAVMLSYKMNKEWTFSSINANDSTLWRFVVAYASAYALNYCSMWVAVDHMKISHYLVQAVNVVVISALLFISQRYWIFATSPADCERLGDCDSTGM
jgi:putative flippase GtrA